MHYITIIEKYLKRNISNYEYISSGRDYDIIITEDLVFRFPKAQKDYSAFVEEKTKLDIIKPYISINIPNYIHIDDKMIVYPLIQGDTMKQFSYHHIPQLVQFIQELHSIPLEKIYSIYSSSDTENKDDTNAFAKYLKKEVQERLSKKNISNSIIKNIIYYIDELFFNFESTTTVFVHGDLQPKNIIINHDNIHGIIDFSDSKIGSPELDFCHLLDYTDLIKEAIELYLGYYDKDFHERIFFLGRRDVIFQIINDDMYNNNFITIVDNLEKYKFLPG